VRREVVGNLSNTREEDFVACDLSFQRCYLALAVLSFLVDGPLHHPAGGLKSISASDRTLSLPHTELATCGRHLGGPRYLNHLRAEIDSLDRHDRRRILL